MADNAVIPLEAAVVKSIGKCLDGYDECFWWKTDERGLPDIVGCYRARFFGIEVKRQENGPYGVTPLQRYKLDKIEEAGGYVCVASRKQDVQLMFLDIDKDLDRGD